MAVSNTVDDLSSNLSHVYFFINITGGHAKEDQNQPNLDNASSTCNGSTQDRSRTSSPGSLETDVTGETTTTASSAEMNPRAANFIPRFIDSNNSSIPPAPIATQVFELRETTSKGFGLFATSYIPRGTLVICEDPLIRITRESMHFAWGAYCRLNSADKATFDSLHGYQAAGLDFETASRTFLIDLNDDSMDEEDIEELVEEQIRVMKIFSVNNFGLPPGDLGIFATASRLNHSCVPNVHHSYNPTLKKITVYTVKDILPDEELCTTYLGGEGHYTVRSQRLGTLFSHFGFTCDCPACADPTGTSDGRRRFMAAIASGLQQFGEGSRSVHQFIPIDRDAALKQAEDLIAAMLDEGLMTVELTKAYRFASMHALALQDYGKAVEYARDEAEVEKNCMGTVLNDLKDKGVATECWMRKVFETIKAAEGEQGVRKFAGLVEYQNYVKKSKQKARKKEAKTICTDKKAPKKTGPENKAPYAKRSEKRTLGPKGSDTNGAQMRGTHTDRPHTDEVQADGAQSNGARTKEAQTNGAKVTESYDEEMADPGIKW